MSFYPLAPSPHQHQAYAWWDGGFTKEDCQKIIQIGESKQLEEGKVGLMGTAVLDHKVRRTMASWITQQDAPWLYEKLGYYVRQLNGEYFGFDITGFYENFQYGVYEAGPTEEESGFYTWHVDEGFDVGRPPRKLSLSIQLSDPSEYEGGDLILTPHGHSIKVSREQGHLFMFPSFYLHRVTPVTRGVRRSLVAWIVGPRFR